MWSPQQEAALKAVKNWLSDPGRPQVFRLFGFAGTGKTTMAKEIAAEAGGRVHFGAYTGKAASVLRAKGCPGASTIHSMIYRPKGRNLQLVRDLEAALGKLLLEPQTPKRDAAEAEIKRKLDKAIKDAAQPAFALDDEAEIVGARLIVIDECSMVDGRVGQDLLSFGIPILVLGDPAQLPPVYGGGFFTNAQPDIMLTEVHRQAAESPVLHLATAVREGTALPLGNLGTSKVINRAMLDRDEVVAAEQIIVGKNKTRSMYNQRLRTLKGFTEILPMPNDKVVCLRNDHKLGVLNGTLWTVEESSTYSVHEESTTLKIKSLDEDTPSVMVETVLNHFLGLEKPSFYEMDGLQEFDYGYALTCHKSQGSQWNDVLIFDESYVFRADAQRWLYTAITRAAEKVTIVR